MSILCRFSKEEAVIRVEIEVSKTDGLKLSGYISSSVLKAIMTVIAGAVALPWLTPFLHSIGVL